MQRPAVLVHGGAGRRLAENEAAASDGCKAAARAAWQVMTRGGDALAAVLAAVTVLEDDPTFNAGVGSCLNADGRVEMDASLMDGQRGAGAGVALITTVRNPIRLAHAVLLDGRHVLLAGPSAEEFARRSGLATIPPESFITPRQRQRWQARQRGDGSTVGAVVVDRDGHLAAATSTGGLMGKLPGRIGDSAIIGAGTYADDVGAASATGDGEAIIIAALARSAVDGLRGGQHPARIAEALVRTVAQRGTAAVGLIVVDRFGRCGAAHNAEHMTTCRRGGETLEAEH